MMPCSLSAGVSAWPHPPITYTVLYYCITCIITIQQFTINTASPHPPTQYTTSLSYSIHYITVLNIYQQHYFSNKHNTYNEPKKMITLSARHHLLIRMQSSPPPTPTPRPPATAPAVVIVFPVKDKWGWVGWRGVCSGLVL